MDEFETPEAALKREHSFPRKLSYVTSLVTVQFTFLTLRRELRATFRQIFVIECIPDFLCSSIRTDLLSRL